MSHYLLSVHAVEGQAQQHPGTPEEMQAFMQKVIDLEAEMDSTGAFVFGGRLQGPEAATVARVSDGAPIITDGPFAESKEHIAGFYIIDAGDLDAAKAWAAKVAEAIGAPIEVRPFFATGRVADQMGQMPGA